MISPLTLKRLVNSDCYMIDIETLDTKTSAVILAICVIRFDPFTGKKLEVVLNRNISLDSCSKLGGTISESTMNWWLKNADVMKRFFSDNESINQALTHLHHRMNDLRHNGREIFLFCKGGSFDFPKLSFWFDKIGIDTSYWWKHYNEIDIRSWFFLQKEEIDKITFAGTKHMPFDDCMHQIDCVKEFLSLASRAGATSPISSEKQTTALELSKANKPLRLRMIVAMGEDGIIGVDNDLPIWKLPSDMAFFKKTTTGQIVVMGRNTWDSLPEKYRPLPNRLNIVISSSLSDLEVAKTKNLIIVRSFSEMLLTVEAILSAQVEKQQVFIIGGATIYEQALESGLVDSIIATTVSYRHVANVVTKNHMRYLSNQNAVYFPLTPLQLFRTYKSKPLVDQMEDCSKDSHPSVRNLFTPQPTGTNYDKTRTSDQL